MVVVGTTSGSVKAFDTASLSQLWARPGCHEGAVASVAVSPAHGVLSVGADAYLCSLDAAAGHVRAKHQAGKSALTAVMACGDASALVASTGVAVYDVKSGERTRKFPGHPAPVRALAVTPAGDVAVSAARGERQAALWSLSEKKRKTAACLLTLEDPAAILECHAVGDELMVAAVTDQGEALLFRLRPGDEAGTFDAQRIARVRAGKAVSRGAKGGAGEPVLAVRLQDDAAIFAFGSVLSPSFQRVEYPSTAREEAIVLGGGAEGARKGAAGAAAMAPRRVQESVLGADNAGEAVRLKTLDGRDKRKRDGDGAGADAAAAEADAMDVDGDAGNDSAPEDEGPTLADRVAALELGQRDAPAAETRGAVFEGGPVKADSLAVLLTQALRSEDRAMLERCLSVGNERIIQNTVRRLLPADAAAFLKAAIERLQTKPSRGSQLSTWIRAVLTCHAGYLMAAPALQPYLTGLYQVIEARVSSYRPLLSLSGRLDLLTAQLRRVAPSAGDQEEDDDLNGPAVVYEEPSSDEEGPVEDPFNPQGVESDDDEGFDGEEDSDDAGSEDDSDGEGGAIGGMGSDSEGDDDDEDDNESMDEDSD